MKKRSLLTAVVMLVVSAILLTSSTYAWFQASHNATVDIVKSGVQGELAGNVLVKATREGAKDWDTSLTNEDLYGTTQSKTLSPLDIDPTGGSVSTLKYADFDTQNYEVKTGSSTSYLTYSWKVKAVNAAAGTNILIPVSFTSGSFGYGVVAVDGNLWRTNGTSGDVVVWGPASGSYYPLGTCTKATDATGGTAGVIDAGEETGTGTISATAVTVNADNVEISVSAASEHTITVYVWAEGQDTDCVGSGSISDVGFSFGGTDGIRLSA